MIALGFLFPARNACPSAGKRVAIPNIDDDAGLMWYAFRNAERVLCPSLKM